MAKDDKKLKKDTQKEQPAMTEWQKRNQEFLQKKAQEKEEQEQAEKRLQELKRAQFSPEKKEAEHEVAPRKNRLKKTLTFDKKAKPKKVRKPREKNPHRNRFLVVVTIFSLVLLLAIFMISPLSTSKTLSVSGNRFTTKKDVVAASKISSGDYLLTVFGQRRAIAQKIVDNDPWVKSASVDYRFPNQFHLSVKEHQVVAYRQVNNAFYPILDNGLVIDEETKQLPNNYLTINLPKKQQIKAFIKAIGSLKRPIRRNIRQVTAESSKSTKDLVLIEMYDGNTVRVPLAKISASLPYYTQVRQQLQGPSVIDMEVGIFVTNEVSESTSDSSEVTTEQTTVPQDQEVSQVDGTTESASQPSESLPSEEVSDSLVQ